MSQTHFLLHSNQSLLTEDNYAFAWLQYHVSILASKSCSPWLTGFLIVQCTLNSSSRFSFFTCSCWHTDILSNLIPCWWFCNISPPLTLAATLLIGKLSLWGRTTHFFMRGLEYIHFIVTLLYPWLIKMEINKLIPTILIIIITR